MPTSPCYDLAKKLKAAIDERMLGEQVQSIGQRGRTVAYADVPLDKLIAYYNQTRNACPEALEDTALIAIAPLDQPTTTRGGPARFAGRPWV